MSEMKYVFGIDLGTTYSCIAHVDDSTKTKVLVSSEGGNTTPSVVYFESPQDVVVGQIAKETAVVEAENTVSLVKPLMGKSDTAITLDGTKISPEAVSALILKKLAQDASEATGQDVTHVVITVPAYFGAAQRVATQNAGTAAGLTVMEVINEPTAAALYYGCVKDQGKKSILVYDLGGGTFDVTIMDINDGVIEVICSEGIHEIGGKDWDEALMRHILKDFSEQTGHDEPLDENGNQSLRLKAEAAKKQLSGMAKTVVTMEAGGKAARVTITREDFDAITESLLAQTLDETDKAIQIARSKGVEFTEILLVGGSTRMPQVEAALIAKYGMKPMQTDNPDEAVARGAAIHALDLATGAVKWKEEQKNNPGPQGDDRIGGTTGKPDFEIEGGATLPPSPIEEKNIRIIHATTKSYALRVLLNGAPQCNNLIVKNERLENDVKNVTKTYGTAEDNMKTVELVVFENDSMEEYFEVDEKLILGKAILPLSGDLPEGSPIEVTFALNSQGVLKITGLDKTNGQHIEAEMQAVGIMSKEEVDEMREKIKDISVIKA